MYRSERDCIKHLGSRLFMFRTWIIRQRNTVWVRKLTDIVSSLDSKLVSCLRSYSKWNMYVEPFNNIIVGINGCMSVNTHCGLYYLLPNGRSLTTGKLRGKWTTSVSVRSSISYIDNRLVKAGLCLHLIHTLILVVESNLKWIQALKKTHIKPYKKTGYTC